MKRSEEVRYDSCHGSDERKRKELQGTRCCIASRVGVDETRLVIVEWCRDGIISATRVSRVQQIRTAKKTTLPYRHPPEL